MNKSKTEFLIELFDGLLFFEIPFEFQNDYKLGFREFKTRKVIKWVENRVIPSGRQNIDSILKRAGLKEYNEIDIFLYYNGCCCRDDFRIELNNGKK